MTKSIILDDAVAAEVRSGVRRSLQLPVHLREFQVSTTPGYTFQFRDRRALWNDMQEPSDLLNSKFCPFKRGGFLSVREAWAVSEGADYQCRKKWAYQGWPIWYRADGERIFTGATGGGPAFMNPGPWRSASTMPLWACRTRLQITDVRVAWMHNADARHDWHWDVTFIMHKVQPRFQAFTAARPSVDSIHP